MTAMNPIVRKLAETLEAKTTATVASLHNLRLEIMQAIEHAEDNARSIIHAEQITLDIDVEQALAAFTDRLHEMARDAVGRATGMVLCHVENLAAGLPTIATTSEPEPEPADINAAFVTQSREFAAVAYAARQAAEQQNPEPTPEPDATREAEKTAAITGDILTPLAIPTPGLTTTDAAGKSIPWTSQFEAAQPVAQDDPEYAPVALPSPVAAHAVEAQDVAMLPEDDTEEDDQEDGIEDSSLIDAVIRQDGIPVTANMFGLHERRGEGRSARYSPVDGLPVDGEVYYRKVGRKWEPLRYIQG